MGDNKISEEFEAWAAGRDLTPAPWGVSKYSSPHVDNDWDTWRDAWKAARYHLQGEAVPVAYIVPSARVCHDGSMEDGPDSLCFADEADDYVKRVGAPLFAHPQPAELSEVPSELAEAIAAGNGTLHGAIDYWQDRALAAEAKLSEVSGDSGELDERQSAWNDSARLRCLESWAREPGGLLLHAESETGRRGLGLGENCGNRTLAQAIDGCATHAEKDSFAALAATGKQQVGEVQGDALAMIGSNLRSILDLASKMGGGAYQLTVANIQHEANHALQLLQAALASRQAEVK